MFRSLDVALPLLVEAGAARRDVRIRFLTAQVLRAACAIWPAIRYRQNSGVYSQPRDDGAQFAGT